MLQAPSLSVAALGNQPLPPVAPTPAAGPSAAQQLQSRKRQAYFDSVAERLDERSNKLAKRADDGAQVSLSC